MSTLTSRSAEAAAAETGTVALPDAMARRGFLHALQQRSPKQPATAPA